MSTQMFDDLFKRMLVETDRPRRYNGPPLVTTMVAAFDRDDRVPAAHVVAFFRDLCKLYSADRVEWFRSHNLGRFSTVTDNDGRDWQFRSGRDDYETFKLGDRVTARIYPDELFESKLLDGVYLGVASSRDADGNAKFEEKWVLIRNGVVESLLPCEYEKDSPGVLIDGEAVQAAALAARYGIRPPPLSSWTDEAYVRYAKREAESARTRQQWDVEDYGLSLAEKASRCATRFISTQMKMEGFYRRILPPAPVEDPTPSGVSIVESSP